VLRADDRGFGKSTGSFASATTADFATDAEAAIAYLKTRGEVDPKKIGLIGHSEGGIIAPMVAARNPDVGFIVLMAGPGVPGDQILPEQHKLIAEANGTPAEQAEKDATQEKTLLKYVESEKDDNALDKGLREKLTGAVPEAQLGVAVHQLTSPWMKFFLSYDPAPTLGKVKCPVLVLNGEKDLQVPPAQNLPPIRKALAASGNKNYEVDELPGLNHLFQTAKTGSVGEYAEIEETMSPVAMEKMASWILKQTNAK
jgi:pimeloyl-ACP methyl ester carboxylesterase